MHFLNDITILSSNREKNWACFFTFFQPNPIAYLYSDSRKFDFEFSQSVNHWICQYDDFFSFKLFLNRLYLVTNIGFLLFPASIHHADNLTTVNKFNKTVVIFSVFLDECVYFLTNSESLINYFKKNSLKFFRWRRSLYGSFKQLLWRRY